MTEQTITTDFQTAVRMLRDGEASKILSHAKFEYTAYDLKHSAVRIEDAIEPWTVHLVPQVDEIEVVRWWCPQCEDVYGAGTIAESGHCCGDRRLVKLTGTHKIPHKRKVMREREIGRAGDVYPIECCKKEKVPLTATIVARWEEEVG